ncbi:MAG TPA: hypothetical protein VFK05_30640 [Polyangiaceae bacterium]|nr:hypothetical protein [Polyangiaceae bacterium]
MALTVSARSRFTGPSTPSLIKGAALCAAFGIAASLTEYADLGKWLTVAGVLLLIVGLHRFGRLGPDDAIVFELPAPRKKKKRKQPAPSEAEAPAADLGSEAEPAVSAVDDDAER